MLQILIYILFGLFIIGVLNIFVKKIFQKPNSSSNETTTLFEKTGPNGLHFQVVQTTTQETPPGSTLVIPLLPIPISEKQKTVRSYIEVLDSQSKSIWKSDDLSRLRRLPGQIQSLSEIDISRKVQRIFFLEKTPGDILGPPMMQQLDVSGDLPFDIFNLVNFIRESRSDFEKNFGLPIGLIVQYTYRTSQMFREKAHPRENATSFSYHVQWLDIYYTEAETRHHVTVKLGLDKQGLIDLTKEPDYGKKARPEEKDYAWKVVRRLDQFFDELGTSFKDYVEQANQAFMKK